MAPRLQVCGIHALNNKPIAQFTWVPSSFEQMSDEDNEQQRADLSCLPSGPAIKHYNCNFAPTSWRLVSTDLALNNSS